MVRQKQYQKQKVCFSPYTSSSRNAMFKEINEVIYRHGELSVKERVFVLGLAKHKILEGNK